jgi:hypothetical protein
MRRQLADVGCKLHVGQLDLDGNVVQRLIKVSDVKTNLSCVTFCLQEVEADGNCLFRYGGSNVVNPVIRLGLLRAADDACRALGDQIFGDQHQHEEVRNVRKEVARCGL